MSNRVVRIVVFDIMVDDIAGVVDVVVFIEEKEVVECKDEPVFVDVKVVVAEVSFDVDAGKLVDIFRCDKDIINHLSDESFP